MLLEPTTVQARLFAMSHPWWDLELRQATDRRHLRAYHGDREQYPLYEKLAEVLAAYLLVLWD